MRRTSVPPSCRGEQPVVERGARAADVQRAGRGGSEADPHDAMTLRPMLIGAHVSPAGGPAKAVERGAEQRRAVDPDLQPEPARLEADASTRDEEVAAYHEALAASDVDALLIHAVYLLNCASEDPEIREKTLASLIALAAGRRRARRARRRPASRARRRPATSARRSRAPARSSARRWRESDGCPLHLENTAGAGGTLGRSFEELAALHRGRRRRRAARRCAWTPATCSPRASTSAPPRGSTAVLDECVAQVGARPPRLAAPQRLADAAGLQPRPPRARRRGRARRRRAAPSFLSEPRFEDLPCVLETPGDSKKGWVAEDMTLAAKLRKRGLARRAKAAV